MALEWRSVAECRALAESMARDLKGVVSVHNELKVAVDPAALPRQR